MSAARACAVLLSFMALTASFEARAQAPPPIPWLAPDDARQTDCDASVTVDDCMDPAFLWDTECGAEQRLRADSACADLLFGAMEDVAEGREQVLSIVPPTLHESGVDFVTPSNNVRTRSYTPNLFSLHSQRAAGSYAAGGEVVADQYALWEANGNQVRSCREYVYEKYADLTTFHRAANAHWDDGREIFHIAYGPGGERSSIGTRHLSDPWLRGRDGRQFGQLFGPTTRPRHAFYTLTDFPGYSTEFPPPTDVPPLLESLASRSLRAALILGRIDSLRASWGRVQPTWQWHEEASHALSYEHEPEEEGNGQISIDQLQGVVPEPGNFQVDNLGFATEDAVARRRLDAELDEIYQMQLRMQELTMMWRDANTRFVGSGWNVDEAGLAAPPLIAEPADEPLPFAAPDDDDPFDPGLGFAWAPPAPPPIQGPSQIAQEDPETVVRRYVLDELIDLLEQADELGCFQPGWTPCDWSPAMFADRVNNDFSALQDASYEFCNEWSGGNLLNVLNLNVPFVDDPDYPQFHCSVVTGDTITAAGFESMVDQVGICRQAQIDYQIQREIDEAQARVREIDELVNPATGDFVAPGVERGGGEQMGNEFFGLGYSWGYGFSSQINAPICQIDIQAGGHARAWAAVFGQEITLIDGLADMDTVARTVDLHLRVVSKNIFVPRAIIDPEVHIEVPEIEPLMWNISTTFETSKRQKVLDTTIVVVVVPISVAAGIGGRVGIELGLDVYAEPADNEGCPWVEVGGRVVPYVGIDGFVEAAVDIFIAAAGIRGTINILTAELRFVPTLGVEVLALTDDPSDYELYITAKMDLVLRTLSGSIQAFAEIGPCPFCYTGEFTIINWSGPAWENNVFDQEYVVSLADLFAAFPG